MTSRIVLFAVAALLVLDGLIHVLGAVVYMRLGEIDGFAFKTTLLRGRFDLGESGSRVFGALWLLPVFGFAFAGIRLWLGGSWMPLLIVSAVVSLALTGVDWTVAWAGAIVDVAILLLTPLSRYLR